MKDYCKVMRLPRETTGEEIKKVYRCLALQYHHDRNQGGPAYENRRKEVNEAYQVLGDEEKRRQYDLSFRLSLSSIGDDQAAWDDDSIDILGMFACRGFGRTSEKFRNET